MTRVFALSCHAAYRCAQSGECCTAGWAIPVEPARQGLLGAPLLVPGEDGACRYFDRASHLCAVQRDHGERALPESCRQFPRVTLIDDRGVHVTLSHFCPTAAGLLFTGGELAIVEAPAAFPATREYEGLDARGEWPPLVRDSLLFDGASYTAWEQFVVSAFAAGPSEAALARIASGAERLREWTPAEGAMVTVVERLDPTAGGDRGALGRYDWCVGDPEAIVTGAIPEALRPVNQDDRSGSPPVGLDERALCRYLAAKAFGSWTAYQGRGVRTLVAELVLARAVVLSLARTRPLLAAIRESDRRSVHLADRRSLVAALGRAEDRVRQ